MNRGLEYIELLGMQEKEIAYYIMAVPGDRLSPDHKRPIVQLSAHKKTLESIQSNQHDD